MKKISKVLFFFTLLGLFSYQCGAQSQIVFTSATHDTITEYWRVNISTPSVFDNITQKLDLIAPLSGEDNGPITVSRDGNWYAFLSERFDADAQGWSALTLTNSNFSTYEVIHDSSGQVLHSEGMACVLTGGNDIVFVADFGNHSRDIFIIHKNGGNWGMPVNLTAASTYDYNYYPYVSADELKILFDAGNTSFPSTAIGEMNIDGSGLSFPITAASMPGGTAAHSPCYGIDGSIIYEGDASGETLWRLLSGETVPFTINSSFIDDNSPITLADGKIASLWLPSGWHQIKIMDMNGTNDYMLTDSSSLFTEVFDIGFSTGPAYTTSINESPDASVFRISPNPNNGKFSLEFSNPDHQQVAICITDIAGRMLMQVHSPLDKIAFDMNELPAGIYLMKVSGKSIQYGKMIVR